MVTDTEIAEVDYLVTIVGDDVRKDRTTGPAYRMPEPLGEGYEWRVPIHYPADFWAYGEIFDEVVYRERLWSVRQNGRTLICKWIPKTARQRGVPEKGILPAPEDLAAAFADAS